MTSPRDESIPSAPVFRWDFGGDAPAWAAYERLLLEVFSSAPPRPACPEPPWTVLGCFEAGGACVAGIEAAEVVLCLDGVAASMTAIRLAEVAPSHRGHGLFRALMANLLRWCDRTPGRPVLLYTEDHALYTRFDFSPLAQHAFVGDAPASPSGRPARRLDVNEALAVVDQIAPMRAPVSRHCALLGAADILRANLGEDDLKLALMEDLDVLVLFEEDASELVVVDVVAAAMPTMAQIVSAVRPGAVRVRTLFDPDLLDWSGVADPDDTGLMIRGPTPEAMLRPFMLPPTTSF